MWLGRRKGKPRKKRRNAKARYDKEHPVVPIRFHKAVKKQLLKEARERDLTLSEYIRGLLRGVEIRERAIERVVGKPVVRTATKKVENPEKEDKMKQLEQKARELEVENSAQRLQLAEVSEECSAKTRDIAGLEYSLSSCSKRCKKLLADIEVKEKDTRDIEKEVETLQGELTSAVEENRHLSKNYQAARNEVEKSHGQLSKLLEDNVKLNNRLDWALNELKSNDARNKKIAQRIADAHGIGVMFVRTSWNEMPED
jgi:chromosome segregation ATPase